MGQAASKGNKKKLRSSNALVAVPNEADRRLASAVSKSIRKESFRAVVSYVGRFVCCSLGALIISAGGPYAMIVGNLIAGYGGAKFSKFLADFMANKIFGSEDDEEARKKTVENAFHFFGLETNATEAEVNSVYKRMCLIHHPDKTGSTMTEFFKVIQAQRAIIEKHWELTGQVSIQPTKLEITGT